MKLKKIIVLILLIFPCIIFATTKEEIDSKLNNYINSFTYKDSYKKYLYIEKSSIISKKEYNIINQNSNSYLFDGYNFCINNEGNYENCDYIKDTEYVLNNTAVSGKGTFTSPWVFTPYYTYTISSNGNGSISIDDSNYSDSITTTVLKDNKLTIYLEPNNYYKYKSNNCSFQYDNNKLILDNVIKNGNCEVYFELDSYTITYNSNGGNGTMSNSEFIYESDNKLSSNTFTRNGYTFNGWSTSSNGSIAYTDNQSVKNLGNITLYAMWKANSYTVTYNANGGSGSMSNQTLNYDVASNLTRNSFTRTGYTYKGWSTSSNGSVTYTDNQSVTNITAPGETINLYAVWKDETVPTCTVTKTETHNENGVSVTVNCSDDGSGCKTSTITDTKLQADKTYTVYDNAGNSGTCSVSITSSSKVCGRTQYGYYTTCATWETEQTCTKVNYVSKCKKYGTKDGTTCTKYEYEEVCNQCKSCLKSLWKTNCDKCGCYSYTTEKHCISYNQVTDYSNCVGGYTQVKDCESYTTTKKCTKFNSTSYCSGFKKVEDDEGNITWVCCAQGESDDGAAEGCSYTNTYCTYYD